MKLKQFYGSVDDNEKLIQLYDEIQKYGSSKILRARVGDKWGYINLDGSIFIPIDYDNAEFYDKYIHVNKDSNWGVYDRSGQLRIPIIYKDIKRRYFDDDRFWKSDMEVNFCTFIANKDGKWGLVDIDNKTLIDFIYDDRSDEKFLKEIEDMEKIYCDVVFEGRMNLRKIKQNNKQMKLSESSRVNAGKKTAQLIDGVCKDAKRPKDR